VHARGKYQWCGELVRMVQSNIGIFGFDWFLCYIGVSSSRWIRGNAYCTGGGTM